MTGKVQEKPHVKHLIDLTQVPYFPADAPPLVLQEASGLERVRESAPVVETASGYLADRRPQPSDESLFFGGLGLASVMDVAAHPVRARLHRINILTVFAVAVVAGIGIVMLLLASSFKP
ncbi:MAG TPA: hypothetical protein VHB18_13310 [Mycobacteriales bacterium]|jgi:hypothetical protein|nr:hypothetical protein [Mycobacteriales bacterium]